MESPVKIAIFSPASLPAPEEYKKALEFFKINEIEIQSFVNFNSKTPYEKAKEVALFLTEPKWDYLWAVRGGFGCLKLLPYLDEFLSENKNLLHKPCLIGFSDLTALHVYLYKRFKKSGIHAPNVVSLNKLNPKAWGELLDLILRKKTKLVLEGKGWVEGVAEGVVLGGNLATLAGLCGTPYFPLMEEPFILFIEEINEKSYRIERFLLQLIFTVSRENLKGLALGDLGITDIKPILQTLSLYLKKDIPIGYGFSVGHISDNFPFILGKKGRLKVFKDKAIFSQELKL
jgi:muramoyltetrapeptide carboxypeptidase